MAKIKGSKKKQKVGKLDLSKAVCGCGTCQEALDTAFKSLAVIKNGNDCPLWHMLVMCLTLQLISNDQIGEKVDEHGEKIAPFAVEHAQKMAQFVHELSHQILNSGQEEIGTKLAEIRKE